MLIESESVVTVGGGTGSPLINESILRTGKTDNINAIAAVFDSGGATGRRRLGSYGQEIAYSDAMRILLSLVSPDEYRTDKFSEASGLFNHRDVTDRVVGHAIMDRFFDKETGFFQAEKMLKAFGLTINGHVLPSSTESANIAFETKRGKKYIGEHLLDDYRMSKDMVEEMTLTPNVEAYLPATEAVTSADIIVLSCGSIHGSVLSNFLPNGMREALAESSAKMFLVTNLVSTRNETHTFRPLDFVRVVEKYTGKKLSGLIVPDITREQFEQKYPEVAELYDDEHSHFLGSTNEDLRDAEKDGVEIIQHNATTVVEGRTGHHVVRHDPEKLARTFEKILPC